MPNSKSRRFPVWMWGILLPSLALCPPSDAKLSTIQNREVKVGVDLSQGGTISHLSSPPDGENLINTFDRGRQIQQSYYAGPSPYGTAHPNWKGWSWNPIGTGDAYGNSSTVLRHTNDGKTLYVKSIPLQWALNNVPGECTFETWIRLDGSAVRVRNRLANRRSDRTQYPAMHQELPALYTIGKLHRLFTYTGGAPFRGDPISRIENSGPPWTGWRATECWAALVNDAGWGVGIIHPGLTSFIGGFHGKPNVGGSRDDSTGYIAPIRSEILDHNIVYTYEYTLALGTLYQIRERAKAERSAPKLDYVFRNSRHHWTYRNASDAGFPVRGSLKVDLNRSDPQMIGPDGWWPAAEIPRFVLRAAYTGQSAEAALYWKTMEEDSFSESRKVAFKIIPNGKYRTYEVDLVTHPAYKGIITGFRLDPIDGGGGTGESVKIRSMRWRR